MHRRVLHQLRRSPACGDNAIPVAWRDRAGVAGFVREGKRPASASSALTGPLVHTQE
jgi:hypothetical protein